MIYITGDVHGENDIHKFSSDHFPQGKDLTKEDYVIVLGDFGLVWNNHKTELYWRKWLSDKPWTTLFIVGNHENFDLLKEFKTVDKFNKPVRQIADSIFLLERGEIYTIENKTFFSMGGAYSIDKNIRMLGKSWWPEEIPSCKEFEYGLENLEKIIGVLIIF